MRHLTLPKPCSNGRYDPIHIIENFWISIWIGASRFAHSSWLRYNKVLKEIFIWKETTSQSTYSRFFNHKLFNKKRKNMISSGEHLLMKKVRNTKKL
jgi:hypothetical protein